MSTSGADYVVQSLVLWVPDGSPAARDVVAESLAETVPDISFENGNPAEYPAAYGGDGSIVAATFTYIRRTPLSGSEFMDLISPQYGGRLVGTLVTVSRDGVDASVFGGV